MLIVLNGYPGVGKLTIGRALADLLGGRLLDNHSLYNIAFALTEFKSDSFYQTIRASQTIADELICGLPAGTPIILTEVLTEGSAWADECWARILRLAQERGPLFVVHIHCALAENKKRIQGADRALRRKPRDPKMAARNHGNAAVLMGAEQSNYIQLDVTNLSAKDAAQRIMRWIKTE